MLPPVQERSAEAPVHTISTRLALLWRDWWPWIGLPFALVYLILLAAQLGPLIGQTYSNADAASAPVIGQLFGAAHPQQVGLGQLPWYSTLIYELATRWLPLHRQLWEATPYALLLAAVLLIGWSVWQVAGRWAAGIAATLLICASPKTLGWLSSLNDHSPTWFTLALLGAFLVFVEQRADRVALGWTAALTVAVGVIAGMNAASDDLLYVAGLAAVLLAALFSWYAAPSARTRRAALATVALVATAAISAAITVSRMRAAGVISAQSVHFASPEQIVHSFDLWWQSICVLGNGDFFSRTFTFTALLAAACAALSASAVLYVILAARKHVLTVRSSPSREAEGLLITPHLTYWGCSAALLSAAYLLSSSPLDLESSRYLVGLVYAAAAIVPLLGRRGTVARALVVTGTVVFSLAGVIGVAQRTATANPTHFPTGRIAAEVEHIARRLHLDRGYAGYWDAAPITWESDFRVHVYPLFNCASNRLCPAPLHFISTWYAPKPGASFLLADPTQPFVPTAPAYLGKPSAAFPIGQVTMLVYPYDIAPQLHP